MVLLLPILVLFLFSSTRADTKIVSTPDGKTGPEPCVRVCSGVDKDYTRWDNSGLYSGKVIKYIDMSGCDFVSPPIVTAVSGGLKDDEWTFCPSFNVPKVYSSYFALYSVTDFTGNMMKENECKVFWTATGYTC